MRKILFTFIALGACSGSMLANGINVIQPVNIKGSTGLLKANPRECAIRAANRLDELDPTGTLLTPMETHIIHQYHYNTCMGEVTAP